MIDRPSFESSAYGRIDEVLLSIPSWVLRYQRQVEVRAVAAVFRRVLGAFRDHVRFVIFTHVESETHLGEWLSGAGVQDRAEVITVPNRIKLSLWAEDNFTVCKDGLGRRWLLHPISEVRPGDSMAAKELARRFGWGYVEVSRRFQSGNVLVGDDFWLVGADSCSALSGLGIRDASRKLHAVASRVPVPGCDQRSFSTRSIEVGGRRWREFHNRGNENSTVQPLFHIDAFLTLAGRGANGRSQILVGDPALAAKAIGTDLPEHAMRAAFDDIAMQLDEAGFNIIRNPLPLVYQDNHISKARQWYFASTNNVIVEMDGARKTVWLPTYGHGRWCELEATDRMNIGIWEGLGFETRVMGDFHAFAVNLGALKCMTKCLVRSSC